MVKTIQNHQNCTKITFFLELLHQQYSQEGHVELKTFSELLGETEKPGMHLHLFQFFFFQDFLHEEKVEM